MRLQIKIQSFSDVITNSSSETFVINTTEDIKTISKIINKIAEKNRYEGSWEDYEKLSEEEKSKYDNSSGMGGEITVKGWEELYESNKSYIPENKRHLYTPEVWSLGYKESLEELKKRVIIDIDWSREATINWILENLFVCDAYTNECFLVDPNTGRYLKRISEEEWEKLPKNERNGY